MKLKYIINFAVVILILNGISCKEKPTEPPVEEFPPGYQHDIHWPSLADSPWPINHADPQSTGRSKYKGPQFGELEMIVETPELQSGIVIGKDSTIYMTTSTFHNENRGLYAFNIDGTLKWKKILGYSYSAPIVGNDGTIFTNDAFYINAVNPDGTLKWQHTKNSVPSTVRPFGINKDGFLYYMSTDNKINVLNNNGELVWSILDSEFKSFGDFNNLVFSPDGKTLYTAGFDSSVVAVDLINKNIKWKFGKMIKATGTMRLSYAPIVDSYGNIYFSSEDLEGNIYYFSLNENGNVRWKYYIGQKIYNEGTIDRNGNIYFATDTLYSLNHNGELRWKLKLDGIVYNSLLCDNNNNIYIIGNSSKVNSINDKGNMIWQTTINGINSFSSSAAIFNERLYIPSNNLNDFVIIK